MLRKEKVAAQERAALATTEKENTERTAAQQLHAAQQQMRSRCQVKSAPKVDVPESTTHVQAWW